MTVLKFCKLFAKVTELCIIRDHGWIVCAVYIDYEDLFAIPSKYVDAIVKKHEYGMLKIRGAFNQMQDVVVHYIDVET